VRNRRSALARDLRPSGGPASDSAGCGLDRSPDPVQALRSRGARLLPSGRLLAPRPGLARPGLSTSLRAFQAAASLAFVVVALSGASAGSAKKPTPKAPSRPPLDFSGVWELDAKMSLRVSTAMQGAVLSVRQKGDRIWISPVQEPGKARQAILAEEIVADGRPYEKALGPAGKGLVTAGWATDGKALWIEVQAGPPENPRAAIQRSIWKLSEDRKVWVRESVSLSKGSAKSARLVFRKKEAEKK
jgi:hypothetical protein